MDLQSSNPIDEWVQEQHAESAPSEAPSLEETEQQQSQEATPNESPKKLYTEEEVRQIEFRARQSAADKARHEALMEFQRKMAEEARKQQLEEEAKRIEEMDDEELGAFYRERRRQELEEFQRQQEVQRHLHEALAQWAMNFQNRVLSTIKDEETKADLEKRLANDEFKTPEEFVEAVVSARAKEIAQRDLSKKAKEIREAAQKEVTAEIIESAVVPEIGVGTPAPTSRKMTVDELLSAGVAEALERARRERR